MKKMLFSRIIIRLSFIFGWIIIFYSLFSLFGYWSKYKQERSLNLLTWAQVIDADFLHDFEKETGIKINLSYFEHNEELITKLKISKDHGYDLVMPSDHIVQGMIKEGMLQKIDTSKLFFWKDVYSPLKNLYFDPDNNYSVPYFWGILGIGYDKTFFTGKDIPRSWALIFDDTLSIPCMSVSNDSRELIFIAAQYLFGTITHFSQKELDQIKNILIKQKKRVALYTDMRPDYTIANRSCPVGTIFIQDLLKVMKRIPDIDFIIPEEGAFAVIDSFVIPKESKKIELVYQFLNYLYNPTVLQKYVDRYQFIPPTKTVRLDHPHIDRFLPSETLFKNILFFEHIISEKNLYEIWLALKAY